MKTNQYNSISRDTSLDRAVVFAKNHRPSGGLSNLYVIKLVNNDGTVVDEKYGMNLFTDYGMTRFLVDKVAFPQYLYVGNGTGTLNRESQVLLNKITDYTGYASYTNTASYDYPLYYDKDYGDSVNGGLITAVMRYGTFTFSSQRPDGSDFSITEYGIGETIDKLWTHSWIYDSNGDKTYIQRHDADNIVFEVYFCFSYLRTQIESCNVNGIYPVITGVQRFMNQMDVSKVYTYKRNNIKAERTVNRTTTSFMNDRCAITHNLNEFQITNTTDANGGYVDGFAQYYDGFSIITPESTSSPESFTTNPFWSSLNEIRYPDAFSRKFGIITQVPMTRLNISAVNTFDYTSGTWTMPLRFNAASSHDYCETTLQPTLATPIWYTNNDQYIKMYVYQNLNTSDDINKIFSTCETIYATDEYWDTSKWINIQNFQNIPASCKNVRYLIASSNTDASKITTERASGTFYVKPYARNDDSDGYTILPFENNMTGDSHVTCSNVDYGWYAIGSSIFVVNPSTPYRFSTARSSSDWFVYGKWAMQGNDTYSFMLYDMTNVQTTEPIPTTVTPNFTRSVQTSQLYITESKTGLFCMSSGNNEFVVMDLRGSAFDPSTDFHHVTGSNVAGCISGTNKIAYYDNATTYIRVIDGDQSWSNVFSILPPIGFGTPAFIFGIDNYIWISDNSTSYVIDMLTSTITQLDRVISCSARYIRIKATDDMFITFYTNDQYKLAGSSLITTDDPSHNINISDGIPAMNQNDTRFRLDVNIVDTRYVVNNVSYRSLLLLISRAFIWNAHNINNVVFDLGRYIKTGVAAYKQSTDSTTQASLVPYGDYIIAETNIKAPVENYMPISLTGTTRTISTVNNIKAFRSKSWTVEVTNIPTFGTGNNNGIIPGVKN